MTFDEAQELLKEIDEGVGQDTLLRRLRQDLLLYAVRYARMRTEWRLADVKRRQQADSQRRIAHDAFIDGCNILSRNMAKQGRDITWRERLGRDRQVIGDFACYLHCILGLQAR
jgi:hypothetical protein